MSADADQSNELAEHVRSARAPLAITGSNSKRFYVGAPSGELLDVTSHRGIVEYEPTELVITARAGTPLEEIERALAEKGQMLAFEPPRFGDSATLGGTIACGFSGPRRPYAGSARDFVLGVRIINGKGEVLRFGGKVMKNVAGYDIARLMAGSLGTLGVILEVSLKVLPRPASEMTLAFETHPAAAISTMNQWASQPLPLSAAAHGGETLSVRLSGVESAVRAARKRLGGEVVENGEVFWEEIREHRRIFFRSGDPLWRVSVPPATAPLDLPGKWLVDWGGAQRWLISGAPDATIRAAAAKAGGHAAAFRKHARQGDSLTLVDPVARALQARIQQAFDPKSLFSRANGSAAVA